MHNPWISTHKPYPHLLLCYCRHCSALTAAPCSCDAISAARAWRPCSAPSYSPPQLLLSRRSTATWLATLHALSLLHLRVRHEHRLLLFHSKPALVPRVHRGPEPLRRQPVTLCRHAAAVPHRHCCACPARVRTPFITNGGEKEGRIRKIFNI